MNLFLKITLANLILLSIVTCKAQDSLFIKENRAYHELENGISINDSIAWGEFNHTFRIPIGFTYEFLGTEFDSLDVETTGRIVFDTAHHFFADALSEITYQDTGFTAKESSSPITYTNTVGEYGAVLVIQFKNVSFANDPRSQVNFQIRLYEGTNEFELQMGPSTINDFSQAFKNGPFSAIYKVGSFEPLTIEHRLALYGNSIDPTLALDSGEGVNPFDFKLSDVPAEGTVYRFKTTLPTK